MKIRKGTPLASSMSEGKTLFRYLPGRGLFEYLKFNGSLYNRIWDKADTVGTNIKKYIDSLWKKSGDVTYKMDGKVGIGNNVPGSILEVSKVSGSATMELSSWSATATAAHAGALKFQKSGTAAINTFTAGDHTTVNEVLGRVEAWGVTDSDDAALSSYIEFTNDVTSDADSVPGRIIFATSDADDAGSPTERIRIDDGGATKITGACEVRGGTGTGFTGAGILKLSTNEPSIVDGDVLGGISFQAPSELSEGDSNLISSAIWCEADATFTGTANNGELVFATANTSTALATAQERMRIASDGKVGIGTSDPNVLLTVEGSVSLKEKANADSDTVAYGQIWIKSDTPNTLYFTDDAGNDKAIANTGHLASYLPLAGGTMSGALNMDDGDIDNVGGLDIISGNNGFRFDGGTEIQGYIVSDTLSGHTTNNIASTRSIKNYVDATHYDTYTTDVRPNTSSARFITWDKGGRGLASLSYAGMKAESSSTAYWGSTVAQIYKNRASQTPAGDVTVDVDHQTTELFTFPDGNAFAVGDRIAILLTPTSSMQYFVASLLVKFEV